MNTVEANAKLRELFGRIDIRASIGLMTPRYPVPQLRENYRDTMIEVLQTNLAALLDLLEQNSEQMGQRFVGFVKTVEDTFNGFDFPARVNYSAGEFYFSMTLIPSRSGMVMTQYVVNNSFIIADATALYMERNRTNTSSTKMPENQTYS